VSDALFPPISEWSERAMRSVHTARPQDDKRMR
jgi:hypothetical protein